jgi:hypothetical protein
MSSFRQMLALGLCALALTSCDSWPFAPPPVPTPRPTWTPVPSRTPRPTWTPIPTRTPAPSATPRMTQTPSVITVTVVVSATPSAPQIAQRPARARNPQPNIGAAWFFEPHPANPLRNPYIYSVELQAYEHGLALYLAEKDQTWVFAAPGSDSSAAKRVWTNRQGALATVAQAYQLGTARGAPHRWLACAGDTEVAGVVTAYLLLPDARVLSWSIRASDYTPLGWAYLAPDLATGCAQYARAPMAAR